ncbi:hypothetical protein EVAR_86533_1 [Eumeta japonica]|uniref:Uncharacterized protein n=1 Tax=Eumeta variegata TaxID=151549 RepID=A0A4C1VPV8_EUMVA|nr:hypothetical protein EVAR_86533_1 [Eumeta japonica]
MKMKRVLTPGRCKQKKGHGSARVPRRPANADLRAAATGRAAIGPDTAAAARLISGDWRRRAAGAHTRR